MASDGSTGWRKSTRSSTGNCVEVREERPDVVQMRDSKDPQGLVLSFDRQAFGEFVDAIKRSEFDFR
jgi:hypothetical protein